MYNSSQNNLIGKSVDITIGEPWDFTSTVGDYIMRGLIVGAGEFHGKQWISIRVSEFGGYKGL